MSLLGIDIGTSGCKAGAFSVTIFDAAMQLIPDAELDQARWTRDPVARARPGASAQSKKQTGQTTEGWPVHSFRSLMKEMATRCKNRCRVGKGKNAASFTTFTGPTEFQKHVSS